MSLHCNIIYLQIIKSPTVVNGLNYLYKFRNQSTILQMVFCRNYLVMLNGIKGRVKQQAIKYVIEYARSSPLLKSINRRVGGKIKKILTEVISGQGIMSDFNFLLSFLTLFFIKCSTMNMYIFVIK